MKIGMIIYGSKGKANEIWNTQLGLKIGFEKLGHTVQVYELEFDNCKFVDDIIKDGPFDFVIMGWPWETKVLDNAMMRLKNENVKLIFYLDDEPQTSGQGVGRIDCAFGSFTPDLRCYQVYRKHGRNVHWISHWGDEHVFYYDESAKRENKCVTTCGAEDAVKSMHYYLGNSFVQKRIPANENTVFYNSGTVCFQYARFDEITRRIFEAGGCKMAVVTNDISKETGIYDILKPGVDVLYYTNFHEAAQKIRLLLSDDKLRNTLAENLYNKVNKRHRTSIVCQQIINIANGQSDVSLDIFKE